MKTVEAISIVAVTINRRAINTGFSCVYEYTGCKHDFAKWKWIIFNIYSCITTIYGLDVELYFYNLSRFYLYRLNLPLLKTNKIGWSVQIDWSVMSKSSTQTYIIFLRHAKMFGKLWNVKVVKNFRSISIISALQITCCQHSKNHFQINHVLCRCTIPIKLFYPTYSIVSSRRH